MRKAASASKAKSLTLNLAISRGTAPPEIFGEPTAQNSGQRAGQEIDPNRKISEEHEFGRSPTQHVGVYSFTHIGQTLASTIPIVHLSPQLQRSSESQHRAVGSRRRRISRRLISIYGATDRNDAQLLHGSAAGRRPSSDIRSSEILPASSLGRNCRLHMGWLHAEAALRRAGHAA